VAEAIRVTSGAPWSTSIEVGPLRVSCASFDPGYAIESHYHDLGCLSVIVEGGFYQTFPRAEFECPPGGLIVKPPGERHIDRWGTLPSRHLIVEPTVFGDTDDPVSRVFERVSFRLDPRTIHVARRIYAELQDTDDLTRLAVEALALELVVFAGRQDDRRRPGGAPPAWLRRSREYLADEFVGRSSISEVASRLAVHPSRLAREFRRYYGVSPSRYVRELRLERARSDLESGSDTLSAIALRNGFSDQSHLTREFRKATGVTPAAYRRDRGRGL
jgi:AraC-like DNA-binding protein